MSARKEKDRGVCTPRDTKIARPPIVLPIPTAVHMVQARAVLKVGSINRELVKGVQLRFERVVRRPWVGSTAFQHVHPVIDRRTAVFAEHVCLRRRRIGCRICREDHVPLPIDVVQLRGPKIGGVVHSHRRLEEELRLGVVPVPAFILSTVVYNRKTTGHTSSPGFDKA